ncbi:glycoside hydrolase family 127 protein [Paraglaciecola hydrolytica]|uniref:Glycosyl hydrolase n=1 Tax=Paraglaciecola hydrolytica TaxID=1799789 RepID=A0A135ZZ23_9ALTE|nr:glycoside hydrolase family 127 protein [Paraglaciecola hydrolytica]KXI28233.1 glycosyl hydrolase [Paraglaciecola hydrolytica]
MLLRIVNLFLLFSVLYFSQPANTQALELFPLQAVRLTDSPFYHAQQTNIEYLLALEQDKLLAPYLREAGIKGKSDSYGNWESSGLDGHIGGHYLSALSLAFAATGDERLKKRLDSMLTELRKAQLKNANGYLGGIPAGNTAWQQIKQGNIKVDLFSLNDRWVPLYNFHKTLAGLRDAYLIGQSELARSMLLELTDWVIDLVANLSDEQIQQLLISEHGGMNEIFADVYAMTDEEKYLKLARQFSHQLILQPLLKSQDKLNGLHANTQIPKVIGFLRLAELDANQEWQKAADFFWHDVTEKRTVSIGGNSVREHFHNADDFSSMLDSVEGPETCNTYNMLKLSKMLYQGSIDTNYLEYYERATYNHILSSQHPETGGLVYFTPMRSGHYRTYSQVDTSMWCCVGSGIENHSKYGELIYAHNKSELFVNLFIPSTLDWQEQGLSLSLATLFPDQDQVEISIKSVTQNKQNIQTINIRQPKWLADGATVFKLNGKVIKTQSVHKGYLSITRQWQAGDKLELNFSIKPRLEGLPDGSQHYSVLYGPIVLAEKVQPFGQEELAYFADDGRMGHIASGPMCAPEALPVIVGDTETFIKGLKRLPSATLAFSMGEGLVGGKGIESLAEKPSLVPFFRIHESRYQVYWPQMQAAQYRDFVEQETQRSRAAELLASQTIDQINPGEQQPETEHGFAGVGSRAGVNGLRHWRDATDWFSYQLSDPQRQAQSLRLTYFAGDQGRKFAIYINDIKLADVSLKGDSREAFYDMDYPLTNAMRESLQNGKYTVKFVAQPGSFAGGLYGVRLMQAVARP